MIEIHGLYKYYHHQPALSDINLSVPRGVILGLIGPNGAGKTTLVSILVGILPKDQGQIFILGMDMDKEREYIQSKTSIVPQTLAFYPMLTAYENLEYFGSLFGLKGNKLKDRIDFAVEISELKPFLNKRAELFSGGMGRRLNLSIGLLNEPEILYLDEPTVGIDAQARNHILEMIKNIKSEQKTTIIYASHYMEEIEKISDMISIIDHGKIILTDTKESILVKNQNVNLYIHDIHGQSETVINRIKKIKGLYIEKNCIKIQKDDHFYFTMIKTLSLLKKNNINIESISSEEKNLEETYFDLTGNRLRDV